MIFFFLFSLFFQVVVITSIYKMRTHHSVVSIRNNIIRNISLFRFHNFCVTLKKKKHENKNMICMQFDYTDHEAHNIFQCKNWNFFLINSREQCGFVSRLDTLHYIELGKLLIGVLSNACNAGSILRFNDFITITEPVSLRTTKDELRKTGDLSHHIIIYLFCILYCLPYTCILISLR